VRRTTRWETLAPAGRGRRIGPGTPDSTARSPDSTQEPTARWSSPSLRACRAARSASSASRASRASASVRPEVHTPVASRSIVRTVRRVAAGLPTYVGSVTGTGSHSAGSTTAAMPAAVSASGSIAPESSGSSAVRRAGASTTSTASSSSSGCSTGIRAAGTRPRRSPLTMIRQATSQATSSAAGIATYHHETSPKPATPATATLATRISASTLRRRFVARRAAARRARSCAGVGGAAGTPASA